MIYIVTKENRFRVEEKNSNLTLAVLYDWIWNFHIDFQVSKYNSFVGGFGNPFECIFNPNDVLRIESINDEPA